MKAPAEPPLKLQSRFVSFRRSSVWFDRVFRDFFRENSNPIIL